MRFSCFKFVTFLLKLVIARVDVSLLNYLLSICFFKSALQIATNHIKFYVILLYQDFRNAASDSIEHCGLREVLKLFGKSHFPF